MSAAMGVCAPLGVLSRITSTDAAASGACRFAMTHRDAESNDSTSTNLRPSVVVTWLCRAESALPKETAPVCCCACTILLLTSLPHCVSLTPAETCAPTVLREPLFFLTARVRVHG